MAGFGDAPLIQKLAVPGVCILISFLAYSSQLLFHLADLKPGPLTRAETLQFNALLLCLWYTYYKACTVDPGRFTFSTPVHEVPSSDDGLPSDNDDEQEVDNNSIGRGKNSSKKKGSSPRSRWCRKCAAPKPPRAHHCRTCNRCIPKMDHHCPWTGNCVSLTTFPHFWRFLLYANLSLWYLSALLYRRFAALWVDRNLPAYLGPSMPVLVHLSLLLPICFFTTLGLGIMLYATTHDWLENTTTIEGFEIHRHNEILERDRRGGAWWSARAGHDDDDDDSADPDIDPRDRPVIVERVEFPYDIGYWANLTQSMGSSNPLVWVLPWSGAPAVSTTEGKGRGWEWEENGFNHTEGLWPPPDPEKRPPRRGNGRRRAWPGAKVSDDDDAPPPRQYASRDEEIQAFRKRQEDDLRRREETRARLMAELEEVAEFDPVPIPVDDYDDDEVPLAELIRRRKIRRPDDQGE
ncbi:DHHC zinc finger domain-containing protein [Plectosphaerella cucumerina]|uniref:Palmitoyltransferase PFA4 n=1 Tax=Plectosphaerella cucumerina TaxID=40658 RepID=A0A8K0TRH0_9PEZI|nr:DHHC zinc finger domain-containing protein [Plectosphaerella cucumerina]